MKSNDLIETVVPKISYMQCGECKGGHAYVVLSMFSKHVQVRSVVFKERYMIGGERTGSVVFCRSEHPD